MLFLQFQDEADFLSFICLGGGNEVGRSCHIIQYKGKTVMVCIFIPILGFIMKFMNEFGLANNLPWGGIA